MSKINEIYKNIIINGFYDEEHSSKPEIIDGKKHGICLHFSQELIEKLRSNGYLAGLISTLNEDGYLHAAVLYKDLETGEVNIADPVTDVRKLTGLTDEQRNNEIESILSENNWSRDLADYIQEYGPITEYLDNFTTIRTDIKDSDSLKKNLHLIYTSEPEHIQHPIETITDISQIDNLVEDPMKEACKVLYKKGIATRCSDNFEQNKIVEIFLPYTSLSSENRKILIGLVQENPENFEFRSPGGSWMRQSKLETPKDEYDDSQARGFVIKASYEDNSTMADISKKLVDLSMQFEKQVCMEGIYTREDILRNMHELESVDNLLNYPENIVLDKPIETSDTNKKLAKKNNLNYSEKFDIFFEYNKDKSRYIESLYIEDKGKRTNEEIAKENGIYYDIDKKMFFDTEKEAELYRIKLEEAEELLEKELEGFINEKNITPTDIVEADRSRKISKSITDKIKNFFSNIIEKIKGKGER